MNSLKGLKEFYRVMVSTPTVSLVSFPTVGVDTVLGQGGNTDGLTD